MCIGQSEITKRFFRSEDTETMLNSEIKNNWEHLTTSIILTNYYFSELST